ncbi:hypothetical protein ACJZ2D_016255 [Fusarium nematophilum]
MFSWQSTLNLLLFAWIKFIIYFLEASIKALQLITSPEAQVFLPSNVFPLDDFYEDENGTLVFSPQEGTSLYITPLHYGAYYGKTDVVNILLKFYGVDTYPEEDMAIALYLSLINGHRDTARLLLERGASPNGLSDLNALHAAARSGSSAEIRDFIQHHNGNANCKDADGATPAIFALYLPEREAMTTISLLFKNGATATTLFGPNGSWSLASLAEAMGKQGLASWLESKAHESKTFANEWVRA